MRSLLSHLGDIYRNSLFLGNLFEFLNLESDITDPRNPVPIPDPIKQGICFQKVTFHYPSSNHDALNDFDLTIPADRPSQL